MLLRLNRRLISAILTREDPRVPDIEVNFERLTDDHVKKGEIPLCSSKTQIVDELKFF